MSNINAIRMNKKQISDRLLAWYQKYGRSLPWRQEPDPYRVWLSEIMLQQTQVDTVRPYYRRFLEKFPDIETLAASSLEDVLKVWENMGYYRRAHGLHQAARTIVAHYGGHMPETRTDLMALPGIGAYTAGAILSIAFGQAVAAVDGNVRRIICRLVAIEDAPDKSAIQKRIQETAQSLVPADGRAGHFNQALMDLGAMICLARSPRCSECPIRSNCLAYARNIQEAIPFKTKGRPLPHRQGVAGIVYDDEARVLVVQRPARGLLASLWKFPGGMVEPNESPEAGMRRSIQEELGISVQPEYMMGTVRHAYTHFRLTLHIWSCRHRRGAIRALQCQQWQWVDPERLREFPFSKADRMVISSLLNLDQREDSPAGRTQWREAIDTL